MTDNSCREFTDAAGVTWTVQWVEPIAMSEAFDRMRDLKARASGHVEADARGPWLSFESETGEKRRLAPAPTDWSSAQLDDLDRWCAAAVPVQARQPRE
jgi:hypothetical protein